MPIVIAFVLATSFADNPPPRGHAAIAYDEARGAIVLSGGLVFKGAGGEGLTFLNDVWTWNGRAWQALAVSGPKMAGQALAFDTKRRRLLELGGWLGGANESGDLFAIADHEWTRLSSAPQLRRADATIAYDQKRDRLVTFGIGAAADETWEFDGETWSKAAATGPDGHAFARVVYDSARHKTVLFSGQLEGNAFGKTWEYDGTTWKLVTTSGPGPRVWFSLLYDVKRKRTVMFGGRRGGPDASQPASDLWAYDGATWKKINDGGPSGLEAVCAYDKKRDRIVLWGAKSHENGGSGAETWEFDGSKWERK